MLVVHDGARWLPASAAGLAAQTVTPDTLVVVDTSAENNGTSRAGVAGLLADVEVGAPHHVGFGEAVRRGLAAADTTISAAPGRSSANGPETRWVWLLHDDVRPEPTALERLLQHADAHPDVAVAGPKVRGWNDRRLLLEVGVTIARSGRRETGLDRHEHDQGQHDGTREVLAVSTAGMLVRRDIWDALGGLDPALPLGRDDVDLGWRATLAGHRVVCVTDAVVHHAEAASHGRRPAAAVRGHRHRADRRAAIHVLLANLPLFEVPVAAVRLVVGAVLRALALLVGKRPALALDEVLALLAVLARPDRLVVARRARRRTRTVPSHRALRLLAPPGSGVRHVAETLAPVLGRGPAHPGPSRDAGHPVVESGPTAEELEELPSWSSQVLRRTLARPGVLLALGLGVVALLASRDLLGPGRLMGGALLPAPGSAHDLWLAYTQSWHPVSIGSDTPAPPYLAVLAALGTLAFGRAELVVDLLLLGAVPLAGLSAYLALRGVVSSRPVRVWAAAAYALLPAVVGAVAAGRLGTAAVAVLLPPAARAAARAVVWPGGGAKAAGSLRAGCTAGLLLAVMAAFVPLSFLLALALAGVAAVMAVRAGRRRVLLGFVPVFVVPLFVLLPWLPALAADPSLLLLEAGLPGPGLAERDLAPWVVLLLHPGGPGMYPLVFSVGILLAAAAALLRTDGRATIVAGWVAAIAGLVTGVLVSHAAVTPSTLEEAVVAWPGVPSLVCGAGLLLAAAKGAEGGRHRLARQAFSWRQPAAVGVLVLAVAGPVAAAGWWVVAESGGPIERRDPVLLPAFVAADGMSAERPRTLVLRPRGRDALSYSLLRADGPRLGDAERSPPADAMTGLDAVVADLASGSGGDAAARLVPYGVRYVMVSRPRGTHLVRAVDGVPGLVPIAAPGGSVVWRLSYPSGRLHVAPSSTATDAVGGSVAQWTTLPSGTVAARAEVAAGRAGRLVVVADRRDGGFEATLDGQALTPTTYDGWAQAFKLTTRGGLLELRNVDTTRTTLLWVQVGAVLVALLLALPGARPSDDPDRAP